MSFQKDPLDKEKQQLLGKNFVKNNPIFTNDLILELYEMFMLFADPRTRRADVRDILVTAETLGLDEKYKMIFKALGNLGNTYEEEVDFETFINDLTEQMGNPFDQEGRQNLFILMDREMKAELNADDLKLISRELRFNLTDEDINEVIQNVGGYGSETITYEKFEKYLARKIERKHTEQELLKG